MAQRKSDSNPLTTHVFCTVIAICEKKGFATVDNVSAKAGLSRIVVSLQLLFLERRNFISIDRDNGRIMVNPFEQHDLVTVNDSQESQQQQNLESIFESFSEVAMTFRVTDDSLAWRGIEPGDYLLCDQDQNAVAVFRPLR